MLSNVEQVFDAALAIPMREREVLVALLEQRLTPIDPEVMKEHLAEVHRRRECLEKGEATTISAEEVFAKYGIRDSL